MTVKREFELSEEDAAFIDSRVKTDGADPDGVLGEAINLLRDREELIDRWMREKVIPSYDQWVADGKPLLTEEEVQASLDSIFDETDSRRES
ncbi:MAG: hypothetical protein P0Y65_07670 [Candidatus Devosia phytovorans]|uniref:CopG family transcriptional regulator n=1 Tax=Candidatus Devosia phytovorans TaxID=3121372 RepID=A0AAJ5VY22_9HYPH|nr:hypothetical protein [Devosia sp.]WEK06121.1 MAG: hypothetical protein P0Y65_07670 [Devosia sp.]